MFLFSRPTLHIVLGVHTTLCTIGIRALTELILSRLPDFSKQHICFPEASARVVAKMYTREYTMHTTRTIYVTRIIIIIIIIVVCIRKSGRKGTQDIFVHCRRKRWNANTFGGDNPEFENEAEIAV